MNSPSSSKVLTLPVQTDMAMGSRSGLPGSFHGDGGLGWVSRARRRHVFHKMQLTTSSVDKEFRAGTTITTVCRLPLSGQRDGRQADCPPREGYASDLCSHFSHDIIVLCHQGGMGLGNRGRDWRQRLWDLDRGCALKRRT